jgi:hypothetical protein
MIAESAAELVSVLAPLLVVLAVAAVVASAGGGAREVEAQVDAQAREWALFMFGSSEDADQVVDGAHVVALAVGMDAFASARVVRSNYTGIMHRIYSAYIVATCKYWVSTHCCRCYLSS